VLALGSHGDGIAESACGRLYIPRTLPGERVRVRLGSRRGDGLAAEPIEWLSAAEGRATPPCRHFSRCGGCSLQHLSAEAYQGFKLERLHTALARARITASAVAPLVLTPPGGRRRARFAAVSRARRRCSVGFRERRGHAIVDVVECPVLDHRLVTALPALRDWLDDLLTTGQRTEVTVTQLDGGLDVVLDWPQPPTVAVRERCAAFAGEADLGRLSWRAGPGLPAEPMVQRRPVGASFAGTIVAVPAGCFLQASVAGEGALIAAVLDAAVDARRIVDLFSGAGTFAVSLAAAGRHVLAIDSDGSALAAAASARPGITTQTRDLLARPLAASELAGFAAAVFDPPRAGAAAQAKQLAASGVPTVVAVSCNPQTFARDARLLVNGGYGLERVVPVDQFLWSPHLELAAIFRRNRQRP
jgi:23S rRNA (uracil1939-C5)-methyltransferase